MTTGVPGPNAFSSHFPFLGEVAIQVDLRLELRQDKRKTRGQGLFQARDWLLVP